MYPEQYIQFLAHFNGDRDYFECHEILEEYWKESSDMKKDSIWVGFILLAVSRYHHRRRNFKGAKRTLEKSIDIMSLRKNELTKLGLAVSVLFSILSKLLGDIDKEESYHSFNLPITDPTLFKACMNKCEDRGITWGKDSNLEDESIVHRHKLRDRTSVIEERLKALKNKKGNE
ncbi:DUF309 domain-containing protein [Neobacillus niacini]|uniref:DUF309 domain-containing protein n=1 Tax=Neobacillus niacini TaxID=86668 RepID=UPI0005F09E07|nr:DUF309 domain-containing protein [Neobacillus niacini]